MRYSCSIEIALPRERVTGFLKIIGWLKPGMFKKQSAKMMNYFKKFSEVAD